MQLDFIGSDLVFESFGIAKEQKEVCGDTKNDLKRLERYIQASRNESHDAIVYASGVEFDPSADDAVRFVAERLIRIIGVTDVDFKFSDGEAVNGVVYATTPTEYHSYLSAGGTHNKYVWRSIDLRSKREARSYAERGMSYVPDPIQLGKLLDRLYMDQVNSEIEPIKSPFRPFTRDFKPIYGLIMTIAVCVIGALIFIMQEMG